MNFTAMTEPISPPPQVEAIWTREPIVVDGRLDDSVWQNAPAYPLALSKDLTEDGRKLQETGRVQFAWDDNFFYAAFDFEDSDVVQESDTDQEHHYKTGDVAELFLKPQDGSWYWELYVTPNSLKTAFFFPSRGRLGLPSGFNYRSRIEAAAQVDGTLNDWKDRDVRWTAEMAIPRQELAEAGIPLDPENPWRVFVGRYNYSRYLENVELSMMPPLSRSSYHLYEEWADLKLIKNPNP